MKLNKKLKLTAAALVAGLSQSAMATTAASDEFGTFQTTVEGWASGALGTGLSIAMLLIGAGMGVAKNSPMPALSGIGGAAFLHWGPGIIKNIMGSGAVV